MKIRLICVVKANLELSDKMIPVFLNACCSALQGPLFEEKNEFSIGYDTRSGQITQDEGLTWNVHFLDITITDLERLKEDVFADFWKDTKVVFVSNDDDLPGDHVAPAIAMLMQSPIDDAMVAHHNSYVCEPFELKEIAGYSVHLEELAETEGGLIDFVWRNAGEAVSDNVAITDGLMPTIGHREH